MPASRSRCLVSCETSYVFDTMREDLTCNVLPIVKDAMDGMAYNAGGVASLPSNGYYGYQPHLAHKVKTENTQETMDYECYAAQSVLRLNRKRAWEFGDGAEFKKRRQNEAVPILLPDPIPSQQMQNELHMKKPTHNMPDISRCIMSHYL
ncbi:uncharacterized protein LOC109598544 isoform X2 [Aethina tumida]|uniref:uncharacterized protein LOC109598544 isoform X2 n=1 Tax=Aethina tumida TaxID=116153 RepID=UPI00096B4794|nr:uncharacterized protein LOC109598544 isoform X2 [Aethina tumida]